MNKFQKFLESIKQVNPTLVEGIANAYTLLNESGNDYSDESEITAEEVGDGEPVSSLDTVGAPSTDTSGIAEGLSSAGNTCMKKMKGLVDEHGYWSEPVKQYSIEMEEDESLSPDDRATVHSTHMNMY